jgi:hypothetical protein
MALHNEILSVLIEHGVVVLHAKGPIDIFARSRPEPGGRSNGFCI